MDGAEYNIRQSDPAGRDSWPSGSTAGPVCSATVSIFKYFSLFSNLEGEGGAVNIQIAVVILAKANGHKSKTA